MIKGMVNRLQAMAGFRDGLIAAVLAMRVSFSVAAGEIVLGDFTKGGNGWRAAHHIKDVAVSAAGTSFTVTDNDPWFIGPKITIPAAPAGATKVCFTITCEPTTCGGAWETERIRNEKEGIPEALRLRRIELVWRAKVCEGERVPARRQRMLPLCGIIRGNFKKE